MVFLFGYLENSQKKKFFYRNIPRFRRMTVFLVENLWFEFQVLCDFSLVLTVINISTWSQFLKVNFRGRKRYTIRKYAWYKKLFFLTALWIEQARLIDFDNKSIAIFRNHVIFGLLYLQQGSAQSSSDDLCLDYT